MISLGFFFKENVSLKQQIVIFQNEMDKLRSDNIKLYEKIKFVQTYPVCKLLFL